MHRLEISLNQQARESEINIAAGLRRNLGELLPLKAPRRVGLISNERVFNLYGREVKRSLKAAGFTTLEWLMPEGERYKSFRSLEKAVTFLSENRFERDDLVLALGDGQRAHLRLACGEGIDAAPHAIGRFSHGSGDRRDPWR